MTQIERPPQNEAHQFNQDLEIVSQARQQFAEYLNRMEKILLTDVNPCTAVLTVVRYGHNKQVTIHFNDGKAPETLDFETFKQVYTIPEDEAKKLEKEEKEVFPDVGYAIVEYPLPLLEKGVAFIDSPVSCKS